MTTLLESRYRAVLRLLPAYYRREREEEMVETYLWDVDRDTQDQSRPTLGEVASIAALAVRSRLGAPGAPSRYVLLGSAVRLFALFAVLIQAAAAVVDLVLEVTWAVSHGGAGRHLLLSQFTDQGLLTAVVTAAQWILPLLWTAAYFALLHDRRRLARASALLAALPNLWPLLGPLAGALVAPHPAFATAFGLLAWLPALALCAAYHRDAPPARLPAGSPGLVFMTCCVVTGASVVVLPAAADLAWAPASCFVVGALGWLLWQARRSDAVTPGGALALAALGLLILAVRVAALYPWLHVPGAALYVGGGLVQTAALALVTVVLAVVGRRDLTTAEPGLS
ncbi:hypothetical protein AQI88_08870 [Streptomyces cellostaticus]|uniref:Uncharacterized protein n=1 Tax=Streptomyces cellostaticus TaxID=67285 RepID=A0A101NPL3_9ACTN|nr:hypothetical protein [Streptomyces cellostaticus]KUM97108.1 hypothetical protein AQI88_08870 [Streptomyces cellostaticus]GHI03822.1 hypothetical protein Scel_21430 [Streptomyces cellostaticus]